jgi:hypothetical protein
VAGGDLGSGYHRNARVLPAATMDLARRNRRCGKILGSVRL